MCSDLGSPSWARTVVTLAGGGAQARWDIRVGVPLRASAELKFCVHTSNRNGQTVVVADRFPRHAGPSALWDHKAFRLALSFYLASTVVGWGISLVLGSLQISAAIVLPFVVAFYWATWHWGRKPGSSWPKWVLLVWAGGGVLGGAVEGFTQSPLRFIPAALCLGAVAVLLRGWSQLVVQAVNPAGWVQDPSGRHEFRYWDGTAWTEHVSDAGAIGLDSPIAHAAAWTKRGERWYCLRHGSTTCGQCPNKPVST